MIAAIYIKSMKRLILIIVSAVIHEIKWASRKFRLASFLVLWISKHGAMDMKSNLDLGSNPVVLDLSFYRKTSGWAQLLNFSNHSMTQSTLACARGHPIHTQPGNGDRGISLLQGEQEERGSRTRVLKAHMRPQKPPVGAQGCAEGM